MNTFQNLNTFRSLCDANMNRLLILLFQEAGACFLNEIICHALYFTVWAVVVSIDLLRYRESVYYKAGTSPGLKTVALHLCRAHVNPPLPLTDIKLLWPRNIRKLCRFHVENKGRRWLPSGLNWLWNRMNR